MKKIKSELYRSDNFILSSYLLAAGCELQGIEPQSGNEKKFNFCFIESRLLRYSIIYFYSLKALIKPQDFANAQKTLKSLIYSNKNSDL